MKKSLLFFFLLLTLPMMAQYRVHKGHGPGCHQEMASSLTIVAPKHQSFWLFVDDVLQNERPVRSICITNMWPDQFYVRVELDNESQDCVGRFVDMRRPQSFNIVFSGDLLGLEPSSGNIRPELIMNLFTGQNQSLPNVSPVNPPMPPVPVDPCMTELDFNEFMSVLAEEPFDSGKLHVAKHAVSTNPMCVYQIASICRQFSFEQNKLEFAKYAYTYCTEKNKYYLLTEVFSYESSKTELIDYINGR